MNGKIFFDSLDDLNTFLKGFRGNTALFEVHQDHNGRWVMEFDGGY